MQYLEILVTIFMVYILVLNLSSFEFNAKEFLLIVVLEEVLSCIFLDLGQFIGITPILLISMIFLYKRNKGIVKSISIPIIAVIIIIISDYFLTNMYISLFGMSVDIIKSDNKLYWQFLIIEFVIVLLISKIIGVAINKKERFSNIEFKGKFGLLIIVSLALTLVIFYVNISLNPSDNKVIQINSILFFAYFILLMIIMYILIKSVTSELEAKNKQIQLDSLKEYTDTLENLYTDMRSFRHDYINILSSMVGYMENKDMEGLEKYFNTKIIPLNKGMEAKNYKIGSLKNIELPEIKGIFSSKIVAAQELGIDVFIDIIEPIKRIDMDIIDLCRCVGILLDNAIQAVQNYDTHSTDVEPLKVAIINKEKSVLIVIINSCCKNVAPIHKIYQRGFSTKGEDRGLGLSNLKEIIGRYSNVSLDTIIENSEFKQHIEITNK